MSVLVLLISGLFLASVATIHSGWHLFLFLVVFLITGWFVLKKPFSFYLLFLFLFPLLPSQLPTISKYDYLEFLFLCYTFWWAIDRIKRKQWGMPDNPLTFPLSLLLLLFAMSVLLALTKKHYLLSDVFFLKLKDHWNLLQTHPPSDLAPLRSLLYVLEGAIFYFISLAYLQRDNLKKIIFVMSASATVVSVTGILQYFFHYQLLPYWILENPDLSRINAQFSDPNSLGTYLASVLCIRVFGVHWMEPASRPSWIITLLICIALVFTASRAAWGAAFTTLLFLPAFAKLVLKFDLSAHVGGLSAWLSRRGPYVGFAVIVLLLGVGFLVKYNNPNPDSLLKVVLFTFNPEHSPNEILKGRIQIWKDALIVSRNNPFFGSGMGSFPSLNGAPYFLTRGENVHNYFLQILAETGLPGLLTFAAVIFLIFRLAASRLSTASKGEALITFGFLAALVCFLLTSLTGHPLLLLKLQLVFWTITAVLIVSSVQTDWRRYKLSRFLKALIVIALCIAFVWKFQSTVEARDLPAYEYGYGIWEKDEERNDFRWTASEAISILEVRGTVLSIRLRQFNPDVQNRATFTKIYADDVLLDSIEFRDTDWKEQKYFLPALTQNKLVRIRIVPEKLFIPADRDDRRQLGVAVGSFRWECSVPKPIGVHEMEVEGSNIYYWTRIQASISDPRKGNSLSFRVLPNASAVKQPLIVQFFWNHQLLQTVSLSAIQWEPVALRLPERLSDNEVLTVRVSRTANLKSLQLGEDTRELGVRLEFPLRWGGAAPQLPAENRLLLGAVDYGVSNNQNHPYLLRLFPFEKHSNSNLSSYQGKALSELPALSKFVSNPPEWKTIHPQTPFQGNPWTFIWDVLRQSVSIPPGPALLKIRAAGMISGGEVPIFSVGIDDREIARQPIVGESWMDYYFFLQWPGGAHNLSIHFLNDQYQPDEKLDRNLLIQQISIKTGFLSGPVHEGWANTREGILIAEPVDSDAPFKPQNCCYRTLSNH